MNIILLSPLFLKLGCGPVNRLYKYFTYAGLLFPILNILLKYDFVTRQKERKGFNLYVHRRQLCAIAEISLQFVFCLLVYCSAQPQGLYEMEGLLHTAVWSQLPAIQNAKYSPNHKPASRETGKTRCDVRLGCGALGKLELFTQETGLVCLGRQSGSAHQEETMFAALLSLTVVLVPCPAAALVLVTPQPAPVLVELYYESLCPGCRHFITTQLFPAFEALRDTGAMQAGRTAGRLCLLCTACCRWRSTRTGTRTRTGRRAGSGSSAASTGSRSVGATF